MIHHLPIRKKKKDTAPYNGLCGPENTSPADKCMLSKSNQPMKNLMALGEQGSAGIKSPVCIDEYESSG